MSTAATSEVLVFGVGNPARGDDGLGPAAIARLEEKAAPGVTYDADYQLSVENASEIAEFDVAIFVDAALDGPEPFSFEIVTPGPAANFTSHALEPSAVVTLARDLFSATTETWVLGIRGYEFEMFEEKLTERAEANLESALAFLRESIAARKFAAGPAGPDGESGQ